MTSRPHVTAERLTSSVLLVAGILISLIGLSVTAGWLLHMPLLTSWNTGVVPMSLIEAILVTLLGVATVVRSPATRSARSWRIAAVLLGLVAVSAALLLAAHVRGQSASLEYLGQPIAATVNNVVGGYAMWLGALCLLLVSGAHLAQLTSDDRGPWRQWLGIVAGSLIAGTGGALVLLNITSGVLLDVGVQVALAAPTALSLLLLGVAQVVRARRFARSLSERTYALHVNRQAILAVFIAFVTSTLIGAVAFYEQEQFNVRRTAENELVTITDLRMRSLESWRAARLWDAKQLSSDAALAAQVRTFLTPLTSTATAPILTGRLRQYETYEEYDRITLLDTRGAVRFVLPTGGDATSISAGLRAAALSALAAGQVDLRDFYLDPDEQRPALALLIPMIDGTPTGAPVGVLVLRIAPESSLYPMITGWPSPSTTAETLLVRRDGDDVCYLNPLKFDSQAALRRRVPMHNTDVLAVKAVRGQSGLLEGIDYKGSPVIGMVRQIPNSPWFMVSRIDQAELRAELRTHLWLIVSFSVVLLLGVGAGLGWLWRHQRSTFDRKELALTSALRESEERLRLAVAASGQGPWDLNVETGEMVVSPEYTAIFGYDPQTFHDTNQQSVARIHANDRPRIAAALQDYLEGRVAEYRVEFRAATKTGAFTWVESVGRVVSRTDDGRPLRMIGILTDISERKGAEERLRRSEEAQRAIAVKLRTLLQNSPTVIYTLRGAGGRLDPVDVTENIERIFGFTPEESLQREWWLQHIVPEDRAAALANSRSLSTRDDGTAEFRLVKKDGAVCWIQDTLRVVERSGGVATTVVGAWTDVTERKLAELRSHRVASLYQALSDSNQAIVRSATAADLFPRVCRAVVEKGLMSMAWIGMVNPATDLVELQAAAGDGTAYLNGLRISMAPDDPSGQGPTGTAIRENRPVWSDDFSADPRTAAWHTRAKPFQWKASGALPLVCNGHAVGALNIYVHTGDRLDEDGRALLTEMAANVSYALNNFSRNEQRALIEEQLQDSERRYRTMFAESYLPMLLLNPGTGRIHDANDAAASFYGWSLSTLRGMNVVDITTLSAEKIRAAMARVESDTNAPLIFRHRLASGERRDVEVFTSVIGIGGEQLLLSTVIDVTARLHVEAALRASLKEKEVLLGEVHHRVKNNLQLITSLLRLEAGRTNEPGTHAVLTEMQGRILSLALLHETLYRSGHLAAVDLDAYLEQLTNQLFRSMAPAAGVTLRLDLVPITVELDQAIPCGLLVNELVSNSLKHGFPDNRRGEIRVRLQPVSGGAAVRIEVSDDGVGVPADFRASESSTLGLHLVSILTKQLQGTLTMGQGPGAHFSLVFTPKHSSATPERPQ